MKSLLQQSFNNFHSFFLGFFNFFPPESGSRMKIARIHADPDLQTWGDFKCRESEPTKKGSAPQHKSGWHCNFVIYNLPTVADLLYYGILELPDVAVLGGQLLLQAVRPPLHLHHQGLPRFYLREKRKLWIKITELKMTEWKTVKNYKGKPN